MGEGAWGEYRGSSPTVARGRETREEVLSPCPRGRVAGPGGRCCWPGGCRAGRGSVAVAESGSPAPSASPGAGRRTGRAGRGRRPQPDLGHTGPASDPRRRHAGWSGGFAQLDGRRVVGCPAVPGRGRPGAVGSMSVGARGRSPLDPAPFGDGLIVVGTERWAYWVAYRSDDGRRWRRMAGPPTVRGRSGSARWPRFVDGAGDRGRADAAARWGRVPGGPLPGSRTAALGGCRSAVAGRRCRCAPTGGRIQGVFPGSRPVPGRVVDAGPEEGVPGPARRVTGWPDSGARWGHPGFAAGGTRWVLVGEARDGFVAGRSVAVG